jgi:predicted nucleic acid-binding protein
VIIADTGFWIALADRNDESHDAAVSALRSAHEGLITTWPVVTETCHLLASRLAPSAAAQFVRRAHEEAFEIFDLRASHLQRVETLMVKYEDLPMDLADASLVILAEELGSGRIFSTDRREFHAYRWKNRKPFKNLLALD